MIVALDNTFLTLILNPNSKPRPNPATRHPATYCKERIDAMIDQHSSAGDTIIIPTPCLAELLTAVPSVVAAVSEINSSSYFEIAGFDAKCAIELAIETQNSIKSGDKKGGIEASWNEIKFDRQIAIIAKVNSASLFYTDDMNQAKFATKIGMQVKHTWELILPPKYAQHSFLDNDSQ